MGGAALDMLRRQPASLLLALYRCCRALTALLSRRATLHAGVILAAGVLSAIDAGKRMMEPSGPSAGASSAASKRAASARKQSGDK